MFFSCCGNCPQLLYYPSYCALESPTHPCTTGKNSGRMEPSILSSMSLHPGHLFHRADNRGEVLVAPSGGLPGKLNRAYLLGSRRDGHGARQVHTPAQVAADI